MTDKIQKIREEVGKKLEVMQYQIHRKDAYKEIKFGDKVKVIIIKEG